MVLAMVVATVEVVEVEVEVSVASVKGAVAMATTEAREMAASAGSPLPDSNSGGV